MVKTEVWMWVVVGMTRGGDGRRGGGRHLTLKALRKGKWVPREHG